MFFYKNISPLFIDTYKKDWKKNISKMPVSLLENLIIRYQETHRHYHNLGHITGLLEFLETYWEQINDKISFQLAIWYHDAVYEPLSAENEMQSAILFEKEAAPYLDKGQIEKISTMIRCTQKHELKTTDADEALFLDADLCILAADSETYRVYSEAIRKEYSIVPDELYKLGRQKVLNDFLARPQLYFTTYIRDRYETQARKNLENEIEWLQAI